LEIGMISAFDPFNIKGKANKNNLLIFEIGKHSRMGSAPGWDHQKY